MPAYEFAIDLSVPDNTAFTVLGALRSLGYGPLTRVERTALITLHVRDGAMSADACARALSHAEVVFNPNKHRLALAAAATGGTYEAIVSDIDDDTAALAALLAGRFGIDGLERLERATSWRLFESDAPASRERIEWACAHLLANAHSQRHEVRLRPSYSQIA